MSFRLITSNDTARLADLLADSLGRPRANPLTPCRILVPQSGLQRWLESHIAQRCGVVANLQFTPPAQFTWELLRAAQGTLAPTSPTDVSVLRWRIYQLLGALPARPALQPLADYLQTDQDPLRRYALSLELARVFERMQGYRRQRLLQWEQGEDPGEWQAELWRILAQRIGTATRAASVQAWLARYDVDPAKASAIPAGLPVSLACFACVNVSPDVLRMLAVVGHFTEVDFYLPLPTPEYLGDTPVKRREIRQRLREKDDCNPLILSDGGALAEIVELLYSYQYVQPDQELEQFDADLPRSTLLGRMRDDILKHRAPPAAKRTERLDPSVQFHACHTVLREVQTLHNTLLCLLQDNPTLQPYDIAVMAPDIELYRPAVQAAFGGVARNDPRWLPINLADSSATQLHPLVNVFLKLLDAPNSSWKLDEFTDLLRVPGVMRRFDLDADTVARLARLLHDAGIRWGADETARVHAGGFREFSWAFGTERVVAGFALGDEPGAALVAGTAPLAGVEGQRMGQLEAPLAIASAWRSMAELAEQPQTTVTWQVQLNALLLSCYQLDPDDAAETQALERIHVTLAELAQDVGAVDPDLRLSWPEVRAFLRTALAKADARQRLFTGGVTFCSLMPLRVVPFRVICLLGMNDEAFPRREAGGLDPLLADRRAGRPQLGDRNLRADDRLLFLQLLCAARQVFYVSWIGRDARSGQPLPPSTVITEVLALISGGYLQPGASREDLPRLEPLQPFDPRLFDATNSATHSFADKWEPAARQQRGAVAGRDSPPPFADTALPVLPDENPTPPSLTLDELQRFFADPARAYLAQGLGLAVPREEEAEVAVEPLAPGDPLMRYSLTDALLHDAGADAPDTTQRLRAEGRLPPGQLATIALDGARERAEQLRTAERELVGGSARPDPQPGEVTLADGTRIVGTIVDLYPCGLVRTTAGKPNGKRVLAAHIQQAFACAAAPAQPVCHLLSLKEKKVGHIGFAAPSRATACATLQRLVELMRVGRTEALPLLPRASWEAVVAARKATERDPCEAFTEKLEELAGQAPTSTLPSEFAGANFALAWRGYDFTHLDSALARRFYALAEELFPRPAESPQ
ncbi:MAG TPA: exodeoxyribonuclease V subunit gamma [Nevskiaceae bacterium]|nr:exodeoxyribonuclease V subunit gamma [Nevskiaceae bacterium]